MDEQEHEQELKQKGRLNMKLAKWVGIKHVNVHCGTHDILGGLADGSHLEVQDSLGRNVSVLPNFTESLDDCFKWLVPKGVLSFGADKMVAILTEWVDEAILHGYTTAFRDSAKYLCTIMEEKISKEASNAVPATPE